MYSYCKLLDDEITGLGYVERISQFTFRIVDIYLLKQTVTSSSCVLDIDDQCALMQRLISEGKDPSKLKFWWHSHAHMGAFWSNRDEQTGRESVCDYMISLVINHKGEIKCKLNVYQPIEFKIDNVKVVMIDNDELEQLLKTCQEEIKQKVFKEKSRVVTGFTNIHDYRDEHRERGYMTDASKNDAQAQIDEEARVPPDLFKKNADITIDIEELNAMQLQIFGNHFTLDGFAFVWDSEIKMYNVYNKDNKKLTIDEIEKSGLMPYADPKYFDNNEEANDITLTEKDRHILYNT